jgi:glycosyltransferase involved in cell wall biosynthesis
MNDIVSVITPSYNSASFIEKTIQSVIAQTFTDWELIIVDDCSTDDSINIIHSYVEQDSRINLIQLSKNSGAAVARNTAIKAAQGRYIAFLDGDDLWMPEKLEKQVAFMKRTGYTLTYTYYEKITEDGMGTGHYVTPPYQLSYKEMLRSCPIGCLTVIYDAKQLGKVYMPLIRKRQDWGLWLKILRTTNHAYGLPESLALYRVRKGSISSGKIRVQKYTWQLFREIEGLSFLHSVYYLTYHVIRSVLSRFRAKTI